MQEEKRREQAQTRRPQQDSGTDSAAAHPLAESPGNASQPQAGQVCAVMACRLSCGLYTDCRLLQVLSGVEMGLCRLQHHENARPCR